MSVWTHAPRPTVAGVVDAAQRGKPLKVRARDLNVSPGTLRGWLSKRFTPSADTLLRIAAENRAVRLELIRTLQEIESALVGDVAADAGGHAGDEGGPVVGQGGAAVVARGAVGPGAVAVGRAAGRDAPSRGLGSATGAPTSGPGLTRGRR